MNGHKEAVVVILQVNKRFLAVTRKNGDGIGFPGGKVDFGETAKQAACRELWEETGLYAKPSDLIYVMDEMVKKKEKDGRDFHTFCYMVISWRGDVWQKEDKIKPVWVREEDFSNSPFADFNKKALKALYQKFPSYNPNLKTYNK